MNSSPPTGNWLPCFEALPDLDPIDAEIARREREAFKSDQSRRSDYDENGVRQGGLIAFIRHFWHILEPETPLVDGWVLWAICEHLEAVTRGDITRLLINVPPGCTKSMAVDVFWPAWEWGPMNLAHLRSVAFSYTGSLTFRDNVRFRDLVTSPQYQELWGDRVVVAKKGEEKVSNEHKGWKLASSVGGVGTGERGDRVVLDDPHNVKEAESETVRTETVRWFREAMSNRLNDMERGAIVIIMQRVHEDDVSGAILSLGLDYCHLCIPMEYDFDRQSDEDGAAIPTDIGWTDPRHDASREESDGTLAWPARFPPHVVVRIKQEIGPYAWAGQYQQAPAPRGGGIFQREWWQHYEPAEWGCEPNMSPPIEFVLISIDGAFTEREENDPTGCTVWGVIKDKLGRPRLMLTHAWRKRLAFSGPRIEQLGNETPERYRRRTKPSWGLVEWINETARRFPGPTGAPATILIEAKASGLSAADELRNRYGTQPWSIVTMGVKGDKVARALAAQPTFSQGLVYAPTEKDWADEVITEMSIFPKGRHDDLTDSATQAVNWLRANGLLLTDEEFAAAEIEPTRHRPRPKPLYPV